MSIETKKTKTEGQKSQKIEIEISSDLLNLLKKFCNFIHLDLDKFIEKVLKNQLDYYKHGIEDDDELDSIFDDFTKKILRANLKKVFL